MNNNYGERLASMVRKIQNLARRAGVLMPDYELAVLPPEELDGETLTGWDVVARPVAVSTERRVQGPQSHPHFLVDGGMLGTSERDAYEALRATLRTLQACVQAREERVDDRPYLQGEDVDMRRTRFVRAFRADEDVLMENGGVAVGMARTEEGYLRVWVDVADEPSPWTSPAGTVPLELSVNGHVVVRMS